MNKGSNPVGVASEKSAETQGNEAEQRTDVQGLARRWPTSGDRVVVTWGEGRTAGADEGEVVRVAADHFVVRTEEGAEIRRAYTGDGWRWPGDDLTALPVCSRCGQEFASPREGEVCCVCLAKAQGKGVCQGCGRLRVLAEGVCRRCRVAAADAVVESRAAEGPPEAAGVARLPAVGDLVRVRALVSSPFRAARVDRVDDDGFHCAGETGVYSKNHEGEYWAWPLEGVPAVPEAVCAACAESGPVSELTGGLCKARAPSFAPARVCKGSYGTGPEDDCGAILGSDVEGDYCARCLRFQSVRTDCLQGAGAGGGAGVGRVARTQDILDEAFEAAWVALAESAALDPTTVAACKRLHDMICREVRS